MPLYAPKALRKALSIAVVAACTDLCAARDRVPRCVRPLYCRCLRHNLYQNILATLYQNWPAVARADRAVLGEMPDVVCGDPMLFTTKNASLAFIMKCTVSQMTDQQHDIRYTDTRRV